MHRRILSAALVLAAGMPIAACGGSKSDRMANGDVATPSSTAMPANTAPAGTAPAAAPVQEAQHHSKLKGALVGAAVGHVLGGHAAAGAAAGAILQHERNKRP